MTADREFTIPRCTLHMADGESFVVSITNGDRLQWDLTAPKRKWGKASDSPVLAQTFISYVAARREKHIEGMTWEEFQVALVAITDLDEEPTVIRPTRTEVTDASS